MAVASALVVVGARVLGRHRDFLLSIIPHHGAPVERLARSVTRDAGVLAVGIKAVVVVKVVGPPLAAV